MSDVEDFPAARKPACKLTIDFGELGVKRSSAQIKDWYKKEELFGQQILGVLNFRRNQLRGSYSKCSRLASACLQQMWPCGIVNEKYPTERS